jgi:hypothetical protein
MPISQEISGLAPVELSLDKICDAVYISDLFLIEGSDHLTMCIINHTGWRIRQCDSSTEAIVESSKRKRISKHRSTYQSAHEVTEDRL